MAIQFYDSIDLNRQQLLNVRIQNVANDPSSNNVIGQIIFNTGEDTLKQYVLDDGSGSPGWVAVGSGNTYELEGVGSGDTTAGIRLTDGTNNHDVIIQGGGSTLVTQANDVLTVTSEVGTSDTDYIDMTDTTANGVTTVDASLNAVDGTAAATEEGNGIRYLSKNNKWAEIDTIPGTYDWDVKTFKADGTAFTTTVASGNTLVLNGTESVIANLASDGSLNIDVDLNYGGTADYGNNYIMIPGNGTISSDDTLPFNLYTPGANPPTTETNIVKKSTFGAIPIDALTLVKTYIDDAVVGGLIYQGGYNAGTNSPDLDSSPSSDIKKGWTYTVTNPGTFFAEQVRVGDVLIAEVDAPTELADWTTVQNNIDLADLTTVGIGNVNASAADLLDGLSVTYSGGTATVGLDVTGLDALTAPATDDELVIFDESQGSDGKNKKITVANLLSGTSGVTTFAANVTSITAGTPKTVNHGLNSLDVIVQLFDDATKETIYATVDRTGVNDVALTFNATPPTTVRILVQKIG